MAIAGLAWLALSGCDAGDGNEVRRVQVVPDSIAAELISLGEQDQAPRLHLTADRMQDTVFARELLRGDSVRSRRLREIVDRYGWPDSARVGGPAADAAFLILQHSPDRQFQEDLAPELEALALAGRAPRSDVAMLIDRVLMHAGQPQRYGTQFTLAGNRWVMHPVEDEHELDARRSAMDLPPMDVYIRMMEEFYQAPVSR